METFMIEVYLLWLTKILFYFTIARKKVEVEIRYSLNEKSDISILIENKNVFIREIYEI